ISMNAGIVHYELIANYIYSTSRNVLQLGIRLPANIGLLVFIVSIVHDDVEARGELAAQLAFNNIDIILYLLGHIPRQLYTRPVVMINSEVFGIEILPLKRAVLQPVLSINFNIGLGKSVTRRSK